MNEIEKILKDVDYTIQNVGQRQFTKEAFKQFKESVGVYISSLFVESQKTAKRHKADNISASHVESATKYLVKNSESKISRLWGILGGTLLGAAVSNLLSMTVLGQQFNTTGLVTTIILGIVGSFLVGINIMKE